MKNKNFTHIKIAKDKFDSYCTNYLKNCILKKLTQKNTINIALSGGSTPMNIYSSLANTNLSWQYINFFIVDERCVPLNNEQNNYKNINTTILSKINSKSFSMVREGLSYEKSLNLYINDVKKNVPINTNGFPVFDIIILGMGIDGHTASLFPETKALDNHKDIATLNEVPQLNTNRLTLTYPVIEVAEKTIIFTKGQEKQELLNHITTNQPKVYPIERVLQNSKKIICLSENN